MHNGHAVEALDLRKSFGDFKAVQGVSFAADTSEVLSLLGPNGAGKSTTISMLSGLLIGAVAKGEDQVILFSLIAAFFGLAVWRLKFE